MQKERNERIVELRVKDKKSYAAIGKEFGLTRQRVHQIVKRSLANNTNQSKTENE